MGFNNIYIIKEDSLKEILDTIDKILDDIQKFSSTYKGYSIHIEMHESNSDSSWYAEIIIKHEQENKKGSQKPVEPPKLL